MITLCCVLLALMPGNVASQSLTTRAQVVAATPTAPTVLFHPDGDSARANPVRRFFSWVIQGVTRPFRKRPYVGCSLPPMVSIQASKSSITLPCPQATTGTSTPNCPTGAEVTLIANATDPDGMLLFTWSVTGGRIRGEGRTVIWDLSGVPLGTYTATVEVNDGNQHTANSSVTLQVSICTDCEKP